MNRGDPLKAYEQAVERSAYWHKLYAETKQQRDDLLKNINMALNVCDCDDGRCASCEVLKIARAEGEVMVDQCKHAAEDCAMVRLDLEEVKQQRDDLLAKPVEWRAAFEMVEQERDEMRNQRDDLLKAAKVVAESKRLDQRISPLVELRAAIARAEGE